MVRWAEALQLTRTRINPFIIVSPLAMTDNSARDTKMTTGKRDRREMFYTCSSMLSVIGILLGFALVARIETVARDLRTMDTKFSLQIHQIRDILKESAASSRGSENFDTSNGRLIENLLWIFLVFSPKLLYCVHVLSCNDRMGNLCFLLNIG